jgi:hypothetical protein
MTLLANAGADLRDPATVRAVIDQCDGLVSQLEQALRAAGYLNGQDGAARGGDTPGGTSR